MKKSALLSIFILLLKLIEGQVPFQRIITGSTISTGVTGFSAHQLSDGNYIVGANSNGAVLIKLKLNGDTIWTRNFYDPTFLRADDLIVTKDKGFMLAGSNNVLNDADICLVKTDSLGHTEWVKAYTYSTTPDTTFDEAYSIRPTTEGGYILTGTTQNRAFLMKIDALGNITWQKTYATPSVISGSSVIQTTDHGYAFTGYIDTSITYNIKVYLVRTDSLGNLMWSRSYGSTIDDRGYSIKETTDGGFIITGATSVPLGSGGTINQIYLVKTDRNGQLLWTKTFATYNVEEGGYAVLQTPDKGYLVTGYGGYCAFVAPGTHGSNGFLIKTDSNGVVSYVRNYGYLPNSDGMMHSLERTSDAGFLLGGFTGNGTAICMIKTDSIGNTSCNGSLCSVYDSTYLSTSRVTNQTISSPFVHTYTPAVISSYHPCVSHDICATGIEETADKTKKPVLFPNPGNGQFAFDGLMGREIIEIYDCLGRNVYTNIISDIVKQIDISTQPKGIYFYRVISENKIIGSGKLVIQ